MKTRSDSTIAAWLALLLFGIYLLTFSGRIFSFDGLTMFSVTESLVKRGEYNTDQFWTTFKERDGLGADGESYAKYGLGASLFAAPLYALALALPEIGLVQTSVLSSSIVIALSGALVYLATRRLGYSRGVGVGVTLLFGLATPAWVYARQFWSEPFGLFTLLATFYTLMRWRDRGGDRYATLAGLALGMAVATRVTNAALVPLFAWYAFGDRWRDPESRRGMAGFAGTLGLLALGIAWYDWVRFGSPLATGYRSDETFNNPLLFGLYGLLFSPGKGLFVFNPFFAVLPWSMAILWGRARRELLVILAVTAVYVTTFALWYYWWDGTNWASRFLVPVLPFLALAVAPAVELATGALSSRTRAAFAAIFGLLCAAGVGIEILGVSIPAISYWLRMYRLPMSPARVLFIPELSPFVVYFDMFRPRVLDFAWIQAPDNVPQIDWLVIALTLALIALCGVQLRRAVLSRTEMRNAGRAVAGVLVLFVALALFSMYRYRGDYRFGGLDGYHNLLQTVAHAAQPDDVLILNDDIYSTFFLNENRSRMRWYGVSRDPKQWNAETQALLARLSRDYDRIWLAYNDSAMAPADDPVHDWLDETLPAVHRQDFGDGVHLMLYTTDTR